MTIGDNPAKRRAMFFCSMSLTTLGGSVLILRPSEVVGPEASAEPRSSPTKDPDEELSLIVTFDLRPNILFPLTSKLRHGSVSKAAMQKACRTNLISVCRKRQSFFLQSQYFRTAGSGNIVYSV
jgi:hypothetical protein